MRRNRVKGKGRGKKGPNAVDSNMVNMARSTGSNTEVIRNDLTERRQNFNLIQTPPKNFLSQIHWVRQSVLQPSTYSTSTTIVSENNFAFALNSLANVSSFTTIFDQYCIYAVTMTVSYGNTNSSGQPITMYSAIDYDNTTNVGLSGISAFGTVNQCSITPVTSLVRMVKPCVATAAYTGSFGGFSTTRLWLDCNSTTVQHYGIRTIAAITPVVLTFSIEFSLIVGFRNSHG